MRKPELKKTPICPSADEWIRKLWQLHTMEYFAAVKRNASESVLMRGMNLEPIIDRAVSHKEEDKHRTLTHTDTKYPYSKYIRRGVHKKAE